MFAPTRYLAWARRFYGTVRFDLASSGMPTVPLAELGAPDRATLDDPSGWTATARRHRALQRRARRPRRSRALGTTHALWLAYASLTSPGDEVLVEAPAYEPLVRIAEGMGAARHALRALGRRGLRPRSRPHRARDDPADTRRRRDQPAQPDRRARR